jgi:hypothetical protein
MASRGPQHDKRKFTVNYDVTIWRDVEGRSKGKGCSCCRKAIRIYFSVCVCVCMRACVCVYMRVCECPGAWACARSCLRVALLIQHATHIRHVVTSFVASCRHHIIRHYHINGTVFGNVTEYKMCSDFSLQILSRTFQILKRIWRNIVIYVKTSSYKAPVILVVF